MRDSGFFSLISDQSAKFEVGRVVQVLGEIRQEEPSSKISLQALIVRDFSGVDPALYHRAIAAQVCQEPYKSFGLSAPTCAQSWLRSTIKSRVS